MKEISFQQSLSSGTEYSRLQLRCDAPIVCLVTCLRSMPRALQSTFLMNAPLLGSVIFQLPMQIMWVAVSVTETSSPSLKK